ncbi:MAG: hypothetical protein JW846_06890 [Dehalococcoidia bacterium]|nr:hypothetical protein [Dehalococcoidia bacterium]
MSKRVAAALCLAIVSLLWLSSDKAGDPELCFVAPLPGECGTCPVPPEPLQKGGRLLGIGVAGAIDADYGASFEQAIEMGMAFVELSIAWDDVEPHPGQYDDEVVNRVNDICAEHDTKIALTLMPVDNVALRMPSDLAGKAFDDGEVVERFDALLENVLATLPDVDVFVLSIGNEVDAYLSGDEWEHYAAFLQQTANHARELQPDLKVGVKLRFESVTESAVEQCRSLNEHSDAVLLTYYPVNADFSVRQPWSVDDDLGEVVALFPGREFMVLECGYPSGQGVGSSEEMQAQFMSYAFAAWDHRALSMRVMSFSWLHDVSPEELEALSRYYGSDDARFLEFLATRGLRTYEDSPKMAYDSLQTELRMRSW